MILRGYASMAGELAGDQWNEGDVSCSVVRRVALPDAFFAIDGLLETFLTVLDEFGAFPAVVDRELDRYLPFLATTKVLMARGPGRRRPGDRARGDQGARGRRGAGHAREGRRAQRPARPAGRRRAAPAGPRAQLDALMADQLSFTGAAADQVAARRRRGRGRRAAAPRGRGLHPGRDPLTAPTYERVEVRASTYGDADVVALVAEVQAHYVEIYGGEDETPMTPEDFEAPEGTFVIAEVSGEPVACGAFRRHEGADGAVAEIKRMYVRPAHRHRGVARAVLADLEASGAGRRLRTGRSRDGERQPAAIAFYTRAGYTEIEPYGFYPAARSAAASAKNSRELRTDDETRSLLRTHAGVTDLELVPGAAAVSDATADAGDPAVSDRELLEHAVGRRRRRLR